MPMSSLQDLYVEELKDLLNAENQILKALPKMAKSASNPELQEAFREHEQQTREHVSRLEEIFSKMGKAARGKKCKAMEGLVEEGRELMEKKAEPEVLDAGLIASAQKVEHYEIASYGSVRTYARMLGDDDAAQLLQKTLDEEGDTDEKLTRLAERLVNPQAAPA